MDEPAVAQNPDTPEVPFVFCSVAGWKLQLQRGRCYRSRAQEIVAYVAIMVSGVVLAMRFITGFAQTHAINAAALIALQAIGDDSSAGESILTGFGAQHVHGLVVRCFRDGCARARDTLVREAPALRSMPKALAVALLLAVSSVGLATSGRDRGQV